MITIDQVNAADEARAMQLLGDLHAPAKWIVRSAVAHRPTSDDMQRAAQALQRLLDNLAKETT